jgi:hypothetical protein
MTADIHDAEFEEVKEPKGRFRKFLAGARKPVSWKTVIISALVAWPLGLLVAQSAQTHYLGTVWLADPTTPTNQAAVNGSGQLSVNCGNCSGSGVSTSNDTAYDGTANTTVSATAGAEAVTAAPSLTNGRNYSLFMDLSGSLRTNCVTGCSGGAVTPTDARALGTTSLVTYSLGAFYNGSTTDMAREAVTGTNSVGTGIGASAILGQCLGTPGALTDTRFGNIAMNCTDHSLIVSGGLAQEATTSGTLGSGVMGSVTTAAPSYTNAKMDYLSLTTSGELRIAQSAAANLNATIVGTGTFAAQVTNATAANLKVEAVGNVTPADAKSLGTTSVGTYSYNGIYNGSTIDLAREVSNSMNTTGVGIPIAAMSGQCDDVSQTALTENSWGNARVDCVTHALVVTTTPSATAGGTTLFTLTLAASTNATNVKASAGQVYSISGFNMSSATPIWISLYNNSGTPTCGTNIIQQFMIPGNTTGAGFVYDFATPKAFTTGIAFCATTGIAGTGNAAATTYVLNIDYR